jgi:hypothetical protein
VNFSACMQISGMLIKNIVVYFISFQKVEPLEFYEFCAQNP